MRTADYCRATRFKLIPDLDEPLHVFSVTNTVRVRCGKTILPGYDYSIYVASGTSLVFIEKTQGPVFTVGALRSKIIDKNILSASQ